jgi:hypothetical protein
MLGILDVRALIVWGRLLLCSHDEFLREITRHASLVARFPHWPCNRRPHTYHLSPMPVLVFRIGEYWRQTRSQPASALAARTTQKAVR